MVECEVEYIHPYGRGFIVYTDKPWQPGKIYLTQKEIVIIGDREHKIPIISILSVDKHITLPALREGRSTLLIEYLDIITREKVYTLFSGNGSCIRHFKKALLSIITSSISISYKMDDLWNKGFLRVEDSEVIFTPAGYNLHVSNILKLERRTISTGFSNVGVIYIRERKENGTNEIYIITPPLKRDFFWQLLNLMVEEYIYSQVISKLTETERLVLLLVNQGARVDEIMQKHQLSQEELDRIVEKLQGMGLINKIIILKITEKGKKVVENITE
jgi:hypothetical protein